MPKRVSLTVRARSVLGVLSGAVFLAAMSWGPASAVPVVTDTISTGTTPSNLYMLTVSPDGSRAYVADISGNAIKVINTTTKAMIETVAVGNSPVDVAVTPDGSRLYVTNHGSNSVSVISTATDSVTITIHGFDGPFGVVISADGKKAYVVNKTADTVSVIDTDPSSGTYNAVIDTLSTGLDKREPYWAALTPDGSTVYVTNSLDDSVTAINTSTKVVKQITVGDYPFGLAFTADGSALYVANAADDTASVINPSTNSVSTTITAIGDGPFIFTSAPDSSAMYVTLINDDKMAVIDTGLNTVRSTVTVGGSPYGVAVTPDTTSPLSVGTPIYVANFDPADVSVVQFSPDAPTSVQATAGDKKLDVSWTAPTYKGDAAIKSYTATASPGNKTCTSNTGTPITPSCTISGLTNGTEYKVTVVATSNIGDSAPSQSSAGATPVGKPAAPTSVLLSAGDEKLDVEWTAPTDTGGTAITKYTATTNPVGGTCESTTGTPVTPSCTITGLTNGTSYTVTVVATNAQGDSAPSAPSGSATPATVPEPPTAVQATPGNKSLAVQWTAPTDTGGRPITKYIATTDPVSGTCESNTGTPVTPSCIITGLTNGTEYTVTVVATNTLGDSTASVASAGTTPVGPPDAPTDVLLTPADKELSVEWTAPIETGGTPITGYTATTTPEGKTCTTSGDTQCIIDRLNNGVEYTVRVVATNTQGDSAQSIGSIGIPVGPPTAPRDVKATRGDRKLDVEWTVPANDGGLPITGYLAITNPFGGSCTTAGETRCTIEGLTNGSNYTVVVVATNELGDSPLSDASNVATPATVPDAPTGVTATAGNAQISVQWTVPVGDGGSPITGYTVTASPGGKSCTTTGTSCTIANLTNGTAYTVSVVATNSVGDSLAGQSTPVTPINPEKKRQRPIDAKGRPPASIATSGLTVITGPNARTNAGELIRTRVSGNTMAQGELRYYRVIRGAKGKVSVRTYGYAGVKIVVVQYAPATDTHYPYRKRSVYVDGVKR